MIERYIKTPWDDDPLMLPAFLGCVRWALGNDELMASFRGDTSNRWEPAGSGIERMVDGACGVDFEFMQQFSDWVADNVFGKPEDLYDE